MNVHPYLALASVFVLGLPLSATQPALKPAQTLTADVIIGGGSTAALATAFAAAEQGARTILIEPTNWIGGQFTSSGVPAVDEAWHKITDPTTGALFLDVSRVARDPRNMTPALRDILAAIGNPGRGWVSRYCFEPRIILHQHFEPWQHRLSADLTVLHDTVIKQVEIKGRRFVSLTVIQRVPRDLTHQGYDRLPSQDLADWYSPNPSERFDKRVIRILGKDLLRGSRATPVFVEATEWGELLALSGSDYLQGNDTSDGQHQDNDTCGQSTVFGFAQRFHESATPDPAPRVTADGLGWGMYTGHDDAWSKVWTYRRILGRGEEPNPGDLSLQNWGFSPQTGTGGNDYPFGYLLLSRQQTAATGDNWQGGVDVDVMRAAEQRALAWHQWFKSQAPTQVGADRITLALDVFGTGHGLCKLPYIRDTRRAIGLDGFVLQLDDFVGEPDAKTGTKFPDRIALGAYPADVHFLTTCQYSPRIVEHRDTKPFHIPLRALTHRDFDNLLVAGKTMAQSFMANSATRLHPIEWSTGTAAGVIAAWMSHQQQTSRQAYESVETLQQKIQRYTPIDWSF